MLSLTDRLNLSVELLRSIDVRREATSNRGIGSAVERDILDRELAELTFQWMIKYSVAQSPKPITNTLTSRREGAPV